MRLTFHTPTICRLDVMSDPVVASDGHTYERSAFLRLLSEHQGGGVGPLRSPMTNEPLAHKHLTPNIAIRSAIFELLARSGT